MTIFIEYFCKQCDSKVSWIYADDEIHPASMQGCPGDKCTTLHELNVMTARHFADVLSRNSDEDFSEDEAIEEYKAMLSLDES